MYFDELKLPKNKRIVVTSKKFDHSVLKTNDTGYSLIKILNGTVAAEILPQNGVAYLIEPSKPVDADSSWDYWSFLFNVCGSNNDTLSIVRPGFLESLTCSEVDKLRGSIFEDPQDN